MKWRVGATWIGLLIAGIGIAVWGETHPSSTPVPWILMAALVIGVYTLMLTAFRCPHCGARQIRDKWNWVSVADRCWKCQQLLDSPAVPSDILDEQLMIQENPTLAAEMRRDRLALEDLAQRALTDPTAADQLGRKFEQQVDRARGWVAEVHLHAPDMESQAQEDLRRAENELAQWRALRSGATNSSRLTGA